jgi:hypothetical protein
MIKRLTSLNIVAVAAMAASAVVSAESSAMARKASQHSDSLYYGIYDRVDPPGDPCIGCGPFQRGPDPDFCIECTWPEGAPSYYGSNGG